MARQSLMWTALPNGYSADGTSLRVSVLLSPRLEPQAQPNALSSFFPDWEDWPADAAHGDLHHRDEQWRQRLHTTDADHRTEPRRYHQLRGSRIGGLEGAVLRQPVRTALRIPGSVGESGAVVRHGRPGRHDPRPLPPTRRRRDRRHAEGVRHRRRCAVGSVGEDRGGSRSRGVP